MNGMQSSDYAFWASVSPFSNTTTKFTFLKDFAKDQMTSKLQKAIWKYKLWIDGHV